MEKINPSLNYSDELKQMKEYYGSKDNSSLFAKWHGCITEAEKAEWEEFAWGLRQMEENEGREGEKAFIFEELKRKIDKYEEWFMLNTEDGGVFVLQVTLL